MAEEGGQRRSARISALEEKAKAVALERKAKARGAMMEDTYVPKRRGRKRKSLHDMEEESGNDEDAWNQSPQEMPSKAVLEFILDLMIQRTQPMFLPPPVPNQENGGNFKDTRDFSSVRAKIRDGAYSSMAEFECDVSLITKNPMNFSSAAKFMLEARTISELADQLFSSLRTEPETLPSEDSQKRSHGNELPGEAASSSINNVKPRKGILSRAKKKTYLISSNLTTDPSGKQWEFYDKRATYAPQTSSKSKNESAASLVMKQPEILQLVPTSKGAYIKSYLSFLNGLGTKAQLFGSRLLTKSLNAASQVRNWNPATPLTSTSDPKTQRFNSVGSVRPYTYLRGVSAGPVIREPSQQRSGNVGLLPRSFISNPGGSGKGKAIAVEDRMNPFNSYGGGLNSGSNCLPWERPQANSGGSGNSFFLGGITDVDTSKAIDFINSSNNETTGNDEDNHLLVATLWQANSPDTSSECSYVPPNDSGRFPNVLPSRMIAPSPSSSTPNFAAGSMNFPMESWNSPSPSSMRNNYAGSMMFPIRSGNTPSSSTPNNYAGSRSFPNQSPNIPSPSTTPNNYAGSLSFPFQSPNIPTPSKTPNNYAGSMDFQIQSPNVQSPSATPNNYAGSMNFQIQSPNTMLPGIDSLYAKGNAPVTPATSIPGVEYYKHPQPSTRTNTTAPETPWYETINATTGLGFNFMNPFREGSSNTSAFSLDRYNSRPSLDIQTSEWNRAASWGTQTALDPQNLQAQAIHQKPLPRYSFMQLLQGIPQEQDYLLDDADFVEGTGPRGHQVMANTPTISNGTQSTLIDLEMEEQPDLNLQL